jgi:hypothetical protein
MVLSVKRNHKFSTLAECKILVEEIFYYLLVAFIHRTMGRVGREGF